MGEKLGAAFVAMIVTLIAFTMPADFWLRAILVLFAIGVDIATIYSFFKS